jgi:hypothetical protein
MRWLRNDSRTWSLEATFFSGMVGRTAWMANASHSDGVATKLANVAAASYPKLRFDPIK